jgi:uptake hydrogenase large subunit
VNGGHLVLHAQVRGDTVTRATVVSTRPVVSALFAGRPAAFALACIPRAYAVCGMAHEAAARGALAAARGADVETPETTALERRVATEAIREHLWRLMLDWPRQLGRAPDRAGYAAWYRLASEAIATGEYGPVATALDTRLGDEVLGAPVDVWRRAEALADLPPAARGVASWLPMLCGWPVGRDDGRRPAGGAGLPETAVERSAQTAPVPAGDGPGTLPLVGALWRADERIAARVAARVAALCELAHGLATATPQRRVATRAPAPGVGIARVDTARGWLQHRVRLEEETVLQYDIESPTDRLFARDGAWVRESVGTRCADPAGLRRFLEAWALALDPCVPYAVRIDNAPGEAQEPVPPVAAHA